LLFYSSCSIIYPTKITSGKAATPGDICHVHNIKMHKTIVKIQHGRYSTDFNNKELYPNAKKKYYKGCIKGAERFAIIYHCKQCDDIKQKSRK
jgi:hypothetical protein